MFSIYSQPAAPGFQKVSQAQILHADRQSFVRLSEMFTGNLKASAAAGLPLDPLIEKFETDMSITYYMLPIRTSQSQSSSALDKTDKKRVGCVEPAPKVVGIPNRFQKGGAKGKAKERKESQCPKLSKGCTCEHLKATLFALDTIWVHASKALPALASMCVQYRNAIRVTHSQSTNEMFRHPMFHPSHAPKRNAPTMENEQTADCIPVTLQLGATGYFCMELFCRSGNLTFAMEHFFPDSFGVDHTVGKQRVKVICLDLTREDHQELVTQCAMSGQS